MENENLWTVYNVRLEFLTALCASVPADPNLTFTWIESRKPKVKPPGARSIDEINEEVFATLAEQAGVEGEEEEEKVSGLVFQRVNGVLVLRTATFRAHIKDCAATISSFHVGKIEKVGGRGWERSFAVQVKQCVYHEERDYWTPILRPDGTPVTEADGRMERPLHTYDRGKPINALKLFEYVQPARADFKLKVMNAVRRTKVKVGDKEKTVENHVPVVALKDLETLFMYGGTHGYGGERSNGEGRYIATIERIQERKEVRGNGRGDEQEEREAATT